MLTEKFLENVADALDIFNEEREISLDPRVIFLTTIFLTIFFSFNKRIWVSILGILLSLLLGIILNVKLVRLLKLAGLLALFTTIITLPAIFIGSGDGLYLNLVIVDVWVSLEGIFSAFSLVLRTLAAGMVSAVFLSYLGWRNIIIALRGLHVPAKLVLMVVLFMKLLPIQIRLFARRLFARESRLLTKSLRNLWFFLASILGDMIIFSEYFALRLALGLRSRNFDLSVELDYKYRMGPKDLLLLVTCVVFVSIFSVI